MPQMAPLNWLILFIFFTLMFIIFNMMNYFITNYSLPSLTKMNLSKTPLNWKW
uniref:ATP synthase complex subunit 8 n=1 Tax=Ctenochauliodes yangi TaxID=1641419 RepID=A0A8K1T7T5_9NEOP|nr:ATP synthase F0 subunit 8 [Ctenochauliodes yangi]